MAVRQQQRRGTAAQWTSANPILSAAEIGYETDTNKFKIGDGTNRWSTLSYFVDLDTMIAGAPGLLNSLDEIAAAINDDPTFFTTIASSLSSKAPIASPTFTGTVSGVTKSMVGLGSVDNTADTAKPVSTATQTALDAKLASATAATTYETITNVALKAPLASPALTGVPTAPTAAAATNTTQIATTAFVRGEVTALVNGASAALDTLGELAAALTADEATAATLSTLVGTKAPIASPTFTGTVSGITKSMVGLGSVDNTADTAKPVSTAQQTALDLKANLASPTFTGTVAGITKTMVGLGNVDNTADSAKPVSTAAQTALDLKAPLASPALTGTPTSPTASVGTDTTQVATTEFVKAAIQNISSLNLVLDGGGV